LQEFLALVDRLSAADGPERSRIEAEIWSRFGVDKALLALDMSEFSLSVRRSGILPYLALIRRMQSLTAPIVASHRGEVVKYVADNLMAVFDDTADALRAALAINDEIRTRDAGFRVSIGIDYGRFILVPGDCYGDAVNVACKLGEDVAASGEVLLTEAARARLPTPPPFDLRAQNVSISGLQLDVFGVVSPDRAA
jgi:class 3 adenylate cyclase